MDIIKYNKENVKVGMRVALNDSYWGYFEGAIFEVLEIDKKGVWAIPENYKETNKRSALRWDQFEIVNPKKYRSFEIVKDEFRKHPNVNIKLPQRGSSKSAGYDICTPIDITILPNGITDAIQTDLKVYMQDDEVLLIVPRSSLGFKKGLMLINTIGVIDSDYYENPDNDGNIGFKLKNLTDKEVTIKAGERIMQGIFVKYGTVDNDSCTTERIGGIGSTN